MMMTIISHCDDNYTSPVFINFGNKNVLLLKGHVLINTALPPGLGLGVLLFLCQGMEPLISSLTHGIATGRLLTMSTKHKVKIYISVSVSSPNKSFKNEIRAPTGSVFQFRVDWSTYKNLF